MPRHRTSEKCRPVEEGVPSGSGSTSGQSDTDTELLATRSQGVLTKIPGSLFSYLHTFFAVGKW
jgi:hypothetical protein